MVWGSSEPPVELSPGTGSGGGGGGKSMCRAHTNPPPVSNSQLDFIHLNVAAMPSVFALTYSFLPYLYITKLEWHVWRMQNIDNNSTVTGQFQTNSVSTNVDWFCKKGQCKIDQLTEYQMLFHCDMLWHWR